MEEGFGRYLADPSTCIFYETTSDALPDGRKPGYHAMAAHTHEGKGVLRSRAHPRQQPVTSHRPAAVQADFQVFFRQAKSGDGFRGAQVVDIAQHHHGAVLLRESKHRFFKKDLGSGSIIFGSGRRAQPGL